MTTSEKYSLPIFEDADVADLAGYSEKMAEKLEKAIDDNAYDDTSIKQNITAIKAEQIEQNTKIQENTTNIETLQSENTKLKDNMIQAQVEGESIHIDDASEIKAKITLKGKSEQEVRSGKNIIDVLGNKAVGTIEIINGVTFTVLEDGKIKVNGTATAKTVFYINSSQNVALDDEYWVVSGSSDNVISQVHILNDTTDIYPSGAGTKVNLANAYLKETYLVVLQDVTVNNEIAYLQLEKGEVATEYEQYGASPSPAFRSDIENITGDVEVKVTGKNLMPNNYVAVTTIGQELEDGRILLNGTIEENVSARLQEFTIKAGTYRFSFNNTFSNNSYFLIRNVTDGVYIAQNVKTSYTFTIEKDIVIRITIVLIKDTYTNFVLEPMLTVVSDSDSDDETYDSYKEQTATFPLDDEKLYKDSYLADDGKHHKRKQIVLDGTENWSIQANSFEYSISKTFFENIEATSGSTNLICSHFKIISGVAYNIGYLRAGSNFINFNYDNGEGGIDNWKAYLAKQYANGTPVVVEYELAEEEIIPYTAEQQEAYNQLQNLQLFKGVNNISSKAIMQLDYIKDTNKVVEDLQEQINELRVALISLGGV